MTTWKFAQWFTCCVISGSLMIGLVYLISFVWCYWDVLCEIHAENKARRTERRKAYYACPEWADKQRFDATSEKWEK